MLIVAIAVVAIGLTVGSARRAWAERDAVDRHHRTLDLLGTLAERADRIDPVVAAPTAPPKAYQPQHRARRRRPVSSAAVAAAIGAVVVIVGVGVVLRYRSHPGRVSASPPQSASSTTSSLPGPQSKAASTPSGTAGVVFVSSDNRQARYSVNEASVDLEVVTTGRCWVEVRAALGQGPVVFAGTLPPGARHPLVVTPSTGGIQVVLGNPAGAAITVDGSTLPLPGSTGTQPYTLVFQASA